MHHSNTEWFHNSATNNHLALQPPNTLSIHRASNLSSNARKTDVGICVGMRNLKGESTYAMNIVPNCCKYFVSRPLIPQNWYNNYAQYLHCDETFTKYYPTPAIVCNELNALVVNEYASTNMRDDILKFRQSLFTKHSISPIGDLKYNGGNELIPPTSNAPTVVRDETLVPSLAPPKKKWIRHYMMGEYKLHNLLLFYVTFDGDF